MGGVKGGTRASRGLVVSSSDPLHAVLLVERSASEHCHWVHLVITSHTQPPAEFREQAALPPRPLSVSAGALGYGKHAHEYSRRGRDRNNKMRRAGGFL